MVACGRLLYAALIPSAVFLLWMHRRGTILELALLSLVLGIFCVTDEFSAG
jgi:hypothetical protein